MMKASSKDDKASKVSDTKGKKGIILDDAADQAPAKSSKDKDSKSKSSNSNSKNKDKDTKADKNKDDDDDDTFGFWGSSAKKTSGKNADESKKEIANKDSTNGKASLKKGASKDLEDSAKAAKAAKAAKDPTPSPPKSSKDKASMSTSTSKSATKSSVLDKVREINEKNKAKEEKSTPAADPEPTSKSSKKKKEEEAASKAKDKDLTKLTSKTKETSPVDKKKSSSKDKATVPGGFPGDDMDDLIDAPKADKKSSKSKDVKKDDKKDDKASKDVKKSSKETSKSKSPPTPPPEDKPVKKERPRIAKADAGSSWGLFGSGAKKEVKKSTKSKEDADVSPPPKKEKTAAAPVLGRSKSTKTAKEKDKEKDKEAAKSADKSSDSDKPKKTESRPTKARTSSFGGFFGASAPPVRSKSVRADSTTSRPKTSRRGTADVDDNGLPSPPADDTPEMSSKAAKLMGTDKKGKLSRSASTKTKKSAPDPFPIDSDDMVMVNGIDDPVVNGKTSKDKTSKSKSSKEAEPLKKDLPDRTRSKKDSSSKPRKFTKDLDDDIVMVDADRSSGADMTDGPDDMTFITKPKGLQRSNTTSKRPPAKGMGSFFSSFRKNRASSDAGDKPRAVDDDEVTPRKRPLTGGDDPAKRSRRGDGDKDKKSRRSDREAEGYVYNTTGTDDKPPEGPAREEHRAKRAEKDRAAKEALDAELAAADERRAKRRDAEKAKRAAREQEDKDARHAVRAARRAKDEETRANRELEDEVLASAKPRSKRRETEEPKSSREKSSKTDRRRSHMDRPSTSRKKSSAGAVDDYFDPRNGKTPSSKEKDRYAPHDNDPYAGLGNDHTSSWVRSQLSDPAPPPPVEGTVLEDPPVRGQPANEADDILGDEPGVRRRDKKSNGSKRRSRMYADPIAEDQEERQRRRRSTREPEIGSGSGGSAEEQGRYGERRRSTGLGGVKLGQGEKTYDGKTGAGKRSSWFQKLKGGLGEL